MDSPGTAHRPVYFANRLALWRSDPRPPGNAAFPPCQWRARPSRCPRQEPAPRRAGTTRQNSSQLPSSPGALPQFPCRHPAAPTAGGVVPQPGAAAFLRATQSACSVSANSLAAVLACGRCPLPFFSADGRASSPGPFPRPPGLFQDAILVVEYRTILAEGWCRRGERGWRTDRGGGWLEQTHVYTHTCTHTHAHSYTQCHT